MVLHPRRQSRPVSTVSERAWPGFVTKRRLGDNTLSPPSVPKLAPELSPKLAVWTTSPTYTLAFNGSRVGNGDLALTITVDGPTSPARGHAP